MFELIDEFNLFLIYQFYLVNLRVLLCARRLQAKAKRLLHKAQPCGLSPENLN